MATCPQQPNKIDDILISWIFFNFLIILFLLVRSYSVSSFVCFFSYSSYTNCDVYNKWSLHLLVNVDSDEIYLERTILSSKAVCSACTYGFEPVLNIILCECVLVFASLGCFPSVEISIMNLSVRHVKMCGMKQK